MTTISLTKDNFNETIVENDIVIIDFWASWCGPCQSFAPIFEAASKKHDDMVFAKVNTEEQQGLAQDCNIRSIPTLMIFREQILLHSQAGALPPAQLEDLLDKVKALDMEKVRADSEAKKSE